MGHPARRLPAGLLPDGVDKVQRTFADAADLPPHGKRACVQRQAGAAPPEGALDHQGGIRRRQADAQGIGEGGQVMQHATEQQRRRLVHLPRRAVDVKRAPGVFVHATRKHAQQHATERLLREARACPPLQLDGHLVLDKIPGFTKQAQCVLRTGVHV